MTDSARPPRWPKPLTTGDVALVAAALLTAGWLAARQPDADTPTTVVLQIDGVGRVEAGIDSQWTRTVAGPLGDSVVQVQDRSARFVSSPCPGQICVHRGWLHDAGDVAVCVPNRVVLRLSGAAPRLDGVTR